MLVDIIFLSPIVQNIQCSIIIFAGIFPMKAGAFCTLPTCSRNSPSCSRHLCCRSFSRWIGLSSLQANNKLSACLALTGWTIRAMLQVSRSSCGPGIDRFKKTPAADRADPPHFPSRPVSKILWRQGAIPLIVPFFCNLRISCRQVIKSRQHALVRTKRTAISRCSRTDSCLPLVAAPTKPPHLLCRAARYLRRL